MNMANYNKIFLLISTAVIAVVVCLNVLLDVHRIFGVERFNKIFVDENLRFIKTKYLKEHRDYNAFIFGSSRANFYSSQYASQLSGLNFYNYNSPAEKIDRMLQKVKWLKRNHFSLKRVIIALDFDFMFLADDLLGTAIVTKEHPDISDEPRLDFYVPFLFQFDWSSWKRMVKIKLGRKTHENIRIDLKTGNWNYPQKDEQIARDPQKYQKEYFSHKVPYERGSGRVAVNLERLNDLINFLDREHISRTVIINPYYFENYQSFNEQEYQDWLKDIVHICGEVWDFSGLNWVTKDSYSYYDSSHFRYPVGDKVLERILIERMNSEPSKDDFGVLLNGKINK